MPWACPSSVSWHDTSKRTSTGFSPSARATYAASRSPSAGATTSSKPSSTSCGAQPGVEAHDHHRPDRNLGHLRDHHRHRFHNWGTPQLESPARHPLVARSEEHTSELQSLMRISYADFC